jgi:hypothetical protein
MEKYLGSRIRFASFSCQRNTYLVQQTQYHLNVKVIEGATLEKQKFNSNQNKTTSEEKLRTAVFLCHHHAWHDGKPYAAHPGVCLTVAEQFITRPLLRLALGFYQNITNVSSARTNKSHHHHHKHQIR